MNILEEPLTVSAYYGENVFAPILDQRQEPRVTPHFDARAGRRIKRPKSVGEGSRTVPQSTLFRHQFYLLTKRGLDICGSLCALLLFAPLMLLATLLIKITDWGPVFYMQRRVGLNGREFNCVKFRSMVVDAEKQQVHLEFRNVHYDPRTFKIPDDPRVTWIGRWIRRSSIDEMPQLFNVLIGDMSLVGPRPPVPSEVERYSWTDRRRLEAKPGLTCIWQVSGRSRLPFSEQVRLDLEYIENRSHWLDLKLILCTLPAVLSADGAY